MGSLQARFRRFKRKPGSDLMLYRALRSRTAGEIAANDYLKRLGAAGLRVGAYDAANRRLIERLVANGGNFWPDSGAFCAMAGYLFPTGGTLIPLKDGHDAGTLNAFVSGDWNAVTGLKGDGSTKYVDSNRNNNADGQNNQAIGVLQTEQQTLSFTSYIGAGVSETGATGFGVRDDGKMSTRSRNNANDLHTTTTPSGVSYLGTTRNNSENFIHRTGGVNETVSLASQTPFDGNLLVFARGTTASLSAISDARLAFYHADANLNGAGELAELDSILTDWQTDLANA